MLKILSNTELEADIESCGLDSDQEANIRYLLDCKNLEIIKAKSSQADKILSRLAVIFTDYKNAGFENSAQVTKFIMTEIEEIVKA